LSDTNLQGTVLHGANLQGARGGRAATVDVAQASSLKVGTPVVLRSRRHAASASNLSPCAISMVMDKVTVYVPSAWRCTRRLLRRARGPLSSPLDHNRQKDSRLSRWRPARPCWPGSCRLLCTTPMAMVPVSRACPCRAPHGAQRHEGLWQGNAQRVGSIRGCSPHPLALGKGPSEALQATWGLVPRRGMHMALRPYQTEHYVWCCCDTSRNQAQSMHSL